jgi:hypothetical protein
VGFWGKRRKASHEETRVEKEKVNKKEKHVKKMPEGMHVMYSRICYELNPFFCRSSALTKHINCMSLGSPSSDK